MQRNLDGSWSHDFTNLDFLAPDGHEYQYSVSEDAVPGYETEYGFTKDGDYLILNRKTLEIPVQKIWNDNGNANGSRPTSTKVNLMASRYSNAANLVYNESAGNYLFSAMSSDFDAQLIFDGTVRDAKVLAEPRRQCCE